MPGIARWIASAARPARAGHHGVADVLVDAAAKARDDRVDLPEKALEQAMDILGILRL
jgi:hypothetical protein